jgi:carbonic anhydrase
MQELLAGYHRFRAETWARERDRFEALAEGGQRPRAMVVACSDSRVDPQMVFAAAPGQLFVVRNVANLVPPYQPDAACHGTSAALEFGVRVLGVRHLVVLGHALCGGVRALLEGMPPGTEDFVAPWMGIAREARARVLECAPASEEARQEIGEHETVRLSLRNLLTFPWIREAVEAGRLSLHGGHFGISSGTLSMLDEAGGGGFVPVGDAPPSGQRPFGGSNR